MSLSYTLAFPPTTHGWHQFDPSLSSCPLPEGDPNSEQDQSQMVQALHLPLER